MILIALMLTVKYYGISFFRHEKLIPMVKESEKHLHRAAHHGKVLVSKMKFKNFHRFIIFVASFTHREFIYLKRKFDSNQPKFFLKQHKSDSPKGSVSFFLKDVSDYKKEL